MSITISGKAAIKLKSYQLQSIIARLSTLLTAYSYLAAVSEIHTTKKYRNSNALFFNLILLVCLTTAVLPVFPANGAEPVRIGVLAFRPKPQTLAQWNPLAVALKKEIPERDFIIEALTYPEINHAISNHQVDFVFTNPGHFVQLKMQGRLSAPLATLAVDINGQRTSSFGGVIFCRSGQNQINTLSDIKGKTIAVPDRESLGGYQMQAYELKRAGISLPKDAKLVTTGMPHDNVLKWVLDGRADAGFVRSGVLESAVREGKLDIKQIKILNLQEHQGFPQQISTRLYPEWPFSALSKTDENLARHVAAALFVMEENIPVMNAMRIHGFSIPADYTPVENVLRELRFPPFDATPAFTLPDVFERYRWQVVSAFLAIIAIILLSFRLLLTKRKLEEEKQIVLVQSGQLRASKTRLQTILDNEPECIKIINADGLLTHLNPAGLAMIEADSLAQVIGLPVLDIITPEYRTAYLELHKRVLAGEAMQMEFEVVGFKGGHRLLETHAVPMQDDGSVVHLAITRDITDRKNAEIEKEAALARVKKLEGIVPICMHCKKIRDDKNSWNQLERYISDHSEARFSHGICPECLEEQMTKYNESKKITHN